MCLLEYRDESTTTTTKVECSKLQMLQNKYHDGNVVIRTIVQRMVQQSSAHLLHFRFVFYQVYCLLICCNIPKLQRRTVNTKKKARTTGVENSQTKIVLLPRRKQRS